MTPTILELRAGDLRLDLRPDLGGSIAGLWSGDLAVLRSCEPAALEGARLSGCFPFVPYSNRLAHRHFRWLGREYKTAANFGDSPHSIHGVGWQHAWQVESQREHDAVVSYTHVPDDGWPFAFAAQQVFSLTPVGLNVGLSITNLAPHAAPVGLGWHPYFPKRARSRLHIELSDRWEHDGSNLPTRRVPQPGIDADVAYLDFDHCFEGWQGPARVRDEFMSVRLTSSLPYLVVFTPPTRDIYCVEPISHITNAIHMANPAAQGLRTLQPGERFEAWMKLEIGRV
jgi:aldose 1-epimerase